MKRKIKYPTEEDIIEYNLLSLKILTVKKSDQAEVLNHLKIKESIKECEETKGDIYDKAAILLKDLIQKHAFASGNRRTAFIVTKDFILTNKGKFKIKDNPEYAKVMLGIREGYYSDEEIKEWIKNGKIKKFKR